MTLERKVPTGRIARLARVATLGARVGAGALVQSDATAVAAHTARALGTLRGLAAKVGQMASYVDGIVPEAQRAAFDSVLSTLRARTPSSPFDDIREVIEADLGAPLASRFAELDPIPIASASIAQVHRGRTLEGDEVAVKVQHPGIAEAMESDLSNVSLLESLVAMLGARKLDSRRVLKLLKTRLREELDFEIEAGHMARFTKFHAGDPKIHVPRVYPALSSRHVLTAELVRGATWEEACREPEALRRAYAENLWRAVFRAYLVFGAFNTDPHPGNFIFQPDGRVVLLDFGCVQLVPRRRLTRSRRVHAVACARDTGAFGDAVRELLDSKPGPFEDASIAFMRQALDAEFSSPFRFTPQHCASLVGRMQGLAAMARSAPDREHFAMPPELFLLNRLHFGFGSLIARLDVTVDFASIERELLSGARVGR